MHIYWQEAIHSYINQNIILNLICIYIRIRIYTLNMYTKANYCTRHIAGFVARNFKWEALFVQTVDGCLIKLVAFAKKIVYIFVKSSGPFLKGGCLLN